MALAVKQETAERLQLLLGQQSGDFAPKGPGGGFQMWRLARCDSAEAAGEDGAESQCYPATMLDPSSPDDEVIDGPAVWLSLTDGATFTVPTAGRVYPVVVAGGLDIDGDERQRVFGVSDVSVFVPGASITWNSGSTPGVSGDNSWHASGFTLTIPSAGSWAVAAIINVKAKLTTFAGAIAPAIVARLSILSGAAIPPVIDGGVGVTTTLTGIDFFGTCPICGIIETTGLAIFSVDIWPGAPSGCAWGSILVNPSLLGATSHGLTVVAVKCG